MILKVIGHDLAFFSEQTHCPNLLYIFRNHNHSFLSVVDKTKQESSRHCEC